MKLKYLFLAAVSALAISCSEDDLDKESIFNSSSAMAQGQFDKWLQKNYVDNYNIQFKYRFEFKESDKDYNLSPADYDKGVALAKLTKYMWLESYEKVCGVDFIRTYCPKVMHLVGSPAYNEDGSIVLGTAEGGLKITLYMVNSLTDEMLTDYNTMNEYYFHTLHHEFTHILNQKIPYDRSYDLITESGYVSGNWYMISDTEAHKAGFVTPYAMAEPVEDFAEMLSKYVTVSESEWQAIIDDAKNPDKQDGEQDGADYINAKLDIVRSYMQDAWNINIDDLRDAVLRRASELNTIDLDHLN